MKMKFNLIFLAVAALFLVASCSSDDPVASQTTTGASGDTVALDGTWKPNGGCTLDTTTSSETDTNVISGSSLSLTSDSYWDVTDCSGDPQTTTAISATFVLGDEVDATLDGVTVTATQVDFTVSSATITTNTQAAADDMSGACGITTWEVGVATSILDTDCVGTTELDIIYVDDTGTTDLLYFGDDTGVDTSVDYPTVLDSDPLERQ